MTATTVTPDPAPTPDAMAPATTAPPLTRLIAVELRKAVNTRAGAWLLGLVVVMAAGLMVVALVAGDPADRSLVNFFQFAQLGVSVLLPVVGLLAVTGEWSQRTALTTFALEPRRERVVAAKLAAATLLVLAVTLVTLALAAAANLIALAATDADGSWSMNADEPARAALMQLAGVLVGMAFGLALLSSPLAIVAYFIVPTVWTILGSVVSALETPAEWLDLSMTSMPLIGEEMSGQDWAQLATSMALWFGVPLVVGLIRVTRSEVK